MRTLPTAFVLLALPALYLTLVTGVGVASALRVLAFLLVFAYFPGLAIAHWRSGAPTVTEALAYASVGIVTVSGLTLVARVLAVPQAPILVVAFLVGATAVLRLRGDVLPRWKLDNGAGPLDRFASTALALLFVAQPLYTYLAMGRGPTPSFFGNVDAPFHLSQVFALLRDASWPPESLDVAGFAPPYHYGVQQAAALVSAYGDVPPHVALFTVCCGLFLLTIACSALAIAERLRGGLPASLLLGLLIVFGFDRLSPDAAGFGHTATIYALTAMFVAILCVAESEVRGRTVLLAAVILTLVVARVPDFLALMTGLGLVTLGRLYVERSPRPLIMPAIVGVLAILLLRTFDYTSTGSGIAVSFGNPLASWWADYANGLQDIWAERAEPAKLAWRLIDQLYEHSLVFVAIGLAVLAGGWRTERKRLALLAYAIGPILFANIFVFSSGRAAAGDQVVNVASALTAMLGQAFFFWWALACRTIGDGGGIAPIRRRTILAALAFLAVVPVFWTAVQTQRIVADPSNVYEYADNAALADALSHVPVEGTLLVTNDTRYPANAYVRNDRQMQFAALYGHRNYAANLGYVSPPDVSARLEANRLLAAADWSLEIEGLAARLGWTHYVVHRSAPHGTEVPLAKVYENADYTVYAFDNAPGTGE